MRPEVECNIKSTNGFDVEIENIQLRELTKELQCEVAELREWKERCITHMTQLAPKRNQVMKMKKKTMELKRNIEYLKKNLGKRVVLETKISDMEQSVISGKREKKSLQLITKELQHKLKSSLQKQVDTKQKLKFSLQEFQSITEMFITVQEQDTAWDKEEVTYTERLQDKKNTLEISKHSDSYKAELAVSMDVALWFVDNKGTLSNDSSIENGNKVKELVQSIAKLTEECKKSKMNARAFEMDVLKQKSVHDALQKSLLEQNAFIVIEKEMSQKIAKDVKQYIQLLQSETKKKVGFVPDVLSNPRLKSRIQLLLKDVEEYKSKVQ